MPLTAPDNSAMTKAEAETLQRRLIAHGFNPGPVDGRIGPRTNAAVIAFKRSIGFVARPWVGQLTWNRLMQDPAQEAREVLPAWVLEGLRIKGWHERADNADLRAWLKSDGKTLGDPAVLPWCFTGDVEVLTEDGWQRFDALIADQVYQVDQDGKMSLTKYFPVKKPYDGEINVVRHRSFTLRCDPNHRWWGRWGTVGRKKEPQEPKFGTLSQMTTQGLRIERCVSGNQGCGLSKDQLTLIAAVLSDGTLRRRKDGSVREVVFEVSKPRKIAALSALRPNNHYVQKCAYGPITTKPLEVFTFRAYDWLLAAIDENKELDRALINSMSAQEAEVFLRAYRVFDGTCRRFHLYTSSRQRLDDLMQIAVMAGFRFGVTTKRSTLSTRECFELHIRDDGAPILLHPGMIEQEHFNGTLYCVTVPHGRIVVREHGRGALVTGNCGDFAETCIRLALPGEAFPGDLGRNPYWALHWRQFGIPCDPWVGAVVSISREGGGHVGFAVGQDAARIFVLGGNQSNAVSVAPIEKSRFIAASWRWPSTYIGARNPLPFMTSAEASAVNFS